MATIPIHVVSRRDALGGIAWLGATAILGGHTAIGAQRLQRRIDTHHHYFSPELKRAQLDAVANTAAHSWTVDAALGWTAEKSLEDMERAGVTTAVLSLSATFGNLAGDPAFAVRLVRACNDYAAGLVHRYPGRFGLWASLPLLDVDASLKEIEHAFDDLHADGIGLVTSYGTRWAGDSMFKPVFEELNRRKATVYFHPVTPVCCRNLLPDILDPILEVPEDTARGIVSLLVSGTLARMQNITWLFSHAGGTLPALAGRVNSFFTDHPGADLPEWAPHGVMAELSKLNFDIANAAWPGSMAALRQLVPISHVTFGSDFPYFPSTETAEAMRTLPLTPQERRAIDYDNARRLIPRLNAL